MKNVMTIIKGAKLKNPRVGHIRIWFSWFRFQQKTEWFRNLFWLWEGIQHHRIWFFLIPIPAKNRVIPESIPILWRNWASLVHVRTTVLHGRYTKFIMQAHFILSRRAILQWTVLSGQLVWQRGTPINSPHNSYHNLETGLWWDRWKS